MTTFKAGDKAYHRLRGEWVTLEDREPKEYPLRYEIYRVLYSVTIDGKQDAGDKYPILLDHEPEEHKWKPKQGDLCWFWDVNNACSACRFDSMESGLYVDARKLRWIYCAPFEGELPKGVEL